MNARNLTLSMMSLVILLEGNYPGQDVFTEYLYTWIAAPLIGFTPIEIITFILAAKVLSDATSSGRLVYSSVAFKLLVTMAALPFFAVIFSTFFGLAFNGGSLQIAIWQTRSIWILSALSLVAFYMTRSYADVRQLLNVASVSVFFKALQSLLVYYVDHHGSLSEEWLTSHEASLFMGIVLVYLGCRIVAWPGAAQKIKLLIPVAPIMLHWIVNDRRVSFLGVIFSLAFSLPFLFKIIRPVHVMIGLLGVFLAAGHQVATWNSPNNWLRGIVEPQTDSSSDYREIENFDLYTQVARHPLLGVGFGKPFETPLPLPDIVHLAILLSWIPHNSILMVWSMAGPLGLASVGVFVVFSLAAFVRLFLISSHLELRTFAFVGFSGIVQWMLYAWGDMGLSSPPMCLMPALLTGAGLKILYLRGAV